MALRNRFKQPKTFEKEENKELMPVVWHPTICGIGACQKLKKKKSEPIFTDKK